MLLDDKAVPWNSDMNSESVLNIITQLLFAVDFNASLIILHNKCNGKPDMRNDADR